MEISDELLGQYADTILAGVEGQGLDQQAITDLGMDVLAAILDGEANPEAAIQAFVDDPASYSFEFDDGPEASNPAVDFLQGRLSAGEYDTMLGESEIKQAQASEQRKRILESLDGVSFAEAMNLAQGGQSEESQALVEGLGSDSEPAAQEAAETRRALIEQYSSDNRPMAEAIAAYEADQVNAGAE